MGDPRGFLRIRRGKHDARPAGERLGDYAEFDLPMAEPALRDQAARCMDCGVPFCHDGCPLGNLIPDFNDLVYKGRFREAFDALSATNNFPEITGRVCPAPCEASCVLNIEREPVTIKTVEREIAERALAGGWIVPVRAASRSGKRVAVVGSGPAGLAAAQELARRGHEVVVFEKADRPGGLLRYGIPDFKLDKRVLDVRIEQMRAEGVVFEMGVNVGVDLPAMDLRRRFDALVLAGGAERPRPLEVPGRELPGVHFAMDFLTQQNRRVAGLDVVGEPIVAKGLRVVVLGGGDTGSDCVGTSLRQGARSVLSLELMPRAPEERAAQDTWPAWPQIFRVSSSHEEGGERDFAVMTTRLVGGGEGGRVSRLEAVRVERKDGGKLEPLPGSELSIDCDLVLLAMGFTGPVRAGLLEELGVELDGRGNVAARAGATSLPGVFAAGDMARGQSLVVWAIAEGRRVAERVDAYIHRAARAATSPSPSP